MSQQGKIQLTFIIIAPPDQVAEDDRLFASHAPWMTDTHHRSGDKALLTYNVSKAPELSNPMDLSSAPTGNTCYVLSEVYETEAGVADHYQQAQGQLAGLPSIRRMAREVPGDSSFRRTDLHFTLVIS